MLRALLLITTGLLGLGCGQAIAQNPALAPIAGAAELIAGFAPDPHLVEVEVGGKIDAGTSIGGHCAGYLSEAPNLLLTYDATSGPLYIYASAAHATTLVVADVQGNWLCDDGGAGIRDPFIAVDTAPAGTYAIWVGNYAPGSVAAAAILVSATPIDGDLAPRYGESEWAAGATRDGFQNELEAGGMTPAASVDGRCAGYVTTAPTYTYRYTPGAFSLAAQLQSDADTTLVIRGPDGAWHCDDETAGDGNPLVVIDAPLAGDYDIWLGTVSPAAPVERAADEMLGGLIEWFVGDGAGIAATLFFFEFSAECTLEPETPGAQRC